jgi:hypothetical protein
MIQRNAGRSLSSNEVALSNSNWSRRRSGSNAPRLSCRR